MKRLTPSLFSLILFMPLHASAGACLSDLMDGNVYISSPYGVDRTGRASPGYHQGLDLNNEKKSGAQVRAGSAGTVLYHAFRAGGTAATVSSGDMKFRYLHMDHSNLPGQSRSVSPGQELGRVGCKGMGSCSPHLHLYALMKGSVLATDGTSGRVFKEGQHKMSAPLTGDAIKSALPEAWYYVNPETYLPRQVPIRTAPYKDMPGGWRTTSLPPTCTPDKSSPTNPHSESASSSQDAALSGQAGVAAGSEDFSTKAADEATRSLWLDIARMSAQELAIAERDLHNQEALTAALAQILLVQIDNPQALHPNAASAK